MRMHSAIGYLQNTRNNIVIYDFYCADHFSNRYALHQDYTHEHKELQRTALRYLYMSAHTQMIFVSTWHSSSSL